LLTIATGWEQPDAGSVAWFGSSASGRLAAWTDLAIIPQALGLLDELTIEENITLPIRLNAASDALDPGTLMRRVGVHHLARRFPGGVSLGEQQGAAVARALVLRPTLVLADEPISHQNREWADVIMGGFDDIAASGTAFVIASHNPASLEGAHRVIELHEGRVTR
jgi:putative ABC transport system ATP-binding protein